MLNLESCTKADEPKYVAHKVPYQEYCKDCKKIVTTYTESSCGMLNFVLFIACLFVPCLVLCFWCKCFMDIDHKCPECKKTIGRRDRI